MASSDRRAPAPVHAIDLDAALPGDLERLAERQELENFVPNRAAALVRGGAFVVVNWYDQPRAETTVDGGPPADRRRSPSATTRLETEGGDFTLVRELDLPPYDYALVFER